MKLSPKLTSVLQSLPGALLLVAYLTLLFRPTVDISVIEPFHAYLWNIASWGSIAFAILTLVISMFVPMAYCRYGCPTGRLIDHVRLKATSGTITRFDYATLLLLVVAMVKNI